MKRYILLILAILWANLFFSQDIQMPKPPSQDLERGSNLQNSSIRDSLMSRFGNRSTKLNKNPDAKIEDYLIITRKNDTIVIDTSLTIEKYHKINFLRKDDFELLPFSNTGVAYNTLSFSPITSISPKIGANNKYLSYESVDDVVYYDLPTPFTELMYRSAFEQGQLLDAVYSVNTSRQFNFSISRKGLRSLGNYQNFISSSSNFKLTTNYFSKNNKYRLRTHYLNQKLFAEQNGGINNSDTENFENGVNQFLDRGVFDPNFENAHNEFLAKRFYIDQTFSLKEKDSLNKSSLEIYNAIYFEELKYKFQQSSVDDFFGNAFVPQEINDQIFLNTLNVEAKLSYKSASLGNVDLGLRYVGDKYRLDNYGLNEFVDDLSAINSKTTFFLADYSKKLKGLDLKIYSENYIFGDNNSNLFVTDLRINLKNQNFLSLRYSLASASPNYNYLLYSSNYESYNWNNQFDNTLSNSLGFQFKLKKILDLDVNLISVRKHIQFEKKLFDIEGELGNIIIPVQSNGELDLLKINLKRKINFGKFSIDSRLMFQKSISDDIVNIPDIISRNTIYFSTDMFQKALFLQTGFGIKYFSKYYMNGYDPLLSELYLQNDKKIGEFPLIDFFINAKIQQTRLYLKFEHLNSSFTGYNYYSAPNYPYRDFTFRFGLVWNFFM